MAQDLSKSLPRAARGSILSHLRSAFAGAMARRRDRQHLAQLDAHLLRDIGIDSQEAKAECAKPLWQR